MCENLVLFCKKDIYSFLTSYQVLKEKKKGMMDINLRSVAVVTSLGGGLTLIILRKNYLRRLKRKNALGMCKNGWALHYVVIKI